MKVEFICWLRGLHKHELGIDRSHIRWVEFDPEAGKTVLVLTPDAPLPDYRACNKLFKKHMMKYETHPTWGEVMVLTGRLESKFLQRVRKKWRETCLESA